MTELGLTEKGYSKTGVSFYDIVASEWFNLL